MKRLNFSQALEEFSKIKALDPREILKKEQREAMIKDLTDKMKPFLPREVPMHRRRQTAAVVLFLFFIPLSGLCILLTLYLLYLNVYTRTVMILYLVYIYLIDNAPQTGKRTPFARDWKFWTWFRDYFPVDLHKTTDLDPKAGTYLFGYHPHGIISIGAITNFATHATGFNELFPGIRIRLCTLAQNFKVPFVREITMAHGLVDASKETCKNILGGPPGGAIMLVVGGATESLDAKKGTYTLSLYHKGFVRQALLYGAFLVPVISFGETEVFDLFDNEPGSMMRKIQEFVKSITGVAPAFFKGRAIFDPSSNGILPFREPITSVVGAPIK